MQKILVIQTAFIGDVVLATAILEKLHIYFPNSQLDILVRKGNEQLLLNNPCIQNVLIWDKKQHKILNLFKVLLKIRKTRYHKVINLQRFFATGLLTAFSNAGETIGFNKNPLSILFTTKIVHRINARLHEVERNNDLIKSFTDSQLSKPKLYPSVADEEAVANFKIGNFITITPSSVWFTKQYPLEKWKDFLNVVPQSYNIYLMGGAENEKDCKILMQSAENKNITNLAGKLSFLQSAALMKAAIMNYTNDSAPLHFASSVNAPVTAIFCSTVPAFGFTPLSDVSFIVQTNELLSCRPCGLHGRNACPLGHFNCAYSILTNQLLKTLADESRY